MNIQWYPGHMTKTRRMIAEQIKHVDAVCEILDARIPLSSRNPDVDELTAGKPRLVVLNRVDQADSEATRRWKAHFQAKGYAVLETDAKTGVGTAGFAAAIRELLADKLRAYAEKGMVGRVVRVMILGIPMWASPPLSIRWRAARPPRPRTAPVSPAASSGCRSTGAWSC